MRKRADGQSHDEQHRDPAFGETHTRLDSKTVTLADRGWPARFVRTIVAEAVPKIVDLGPAPDARVDWLAGARLFLKKNPGHRSTSSPPAVPPRQLPAPRAAAPTPQCPIIRSIFGSEPVWAGLESPTIRELRKPSSVPTCFKPAGSIFQPRRHRLSRRCASGLAPIAIALIRPPSTRATPC